MKPYLSFPSPEEWEEERRMNITKEQKETLIKVLKHHIDRLHSDKDFFPTEQYYSIQQIITMLGSEE